MANFNRTRNYNLTDVCVMTGRFIEYIQKLGW